MEPVGPAPLPLDSPGGAGWPCPAPLGLTWWSWLALPSSPQTHLVEPVGPAQLSSDSPGGASWPCPALLRLTWWSRLAPPHSPRSHLVQPVRPAPLRAPSLGARAAARHGERLFRDATPQLDAVLDPCQHEYQTQTATALSGSAIENKIGRGQHEAQRRLS